MDIDTKFVRGATKLNTRIETIRKSIEISFLVSEIQQSLLRRTLARFEREVDPDGRAWKPLTATTLRRKASQGFGDRKILQRTMKMQQAIAVIRGGLGSTFTNTGAGFRIGIQDPEIAEYARVQNSGNRRIPARRFLGIGALDIKSVDSLLRRKGEEIGRIQ